MQDIIGLKNSEFNQLSFAGGMNLLLNDTDLQSNQYREGFNLRNRLGRLDLILSSKKDLSAPPGIKQELTTFGNYEILFCAGFAYYKLYTDTAWRQIPGFSMSPNAPRYWTCAIPVSTTNYLRYAATSSLGSSANSAGQINLNNIAGASAGNLPGLLVQDNINQPQFIFLDNNGNPTCRRTQSFAEWKIIFTDAFNTIIAKDSKGISQDYREYVPIGNVMAWVNGVLYIASPDGNSILRSVSGRPLDFVINVTNLLTISAPFVQLPGGDAYTTSYSVGVGPITCLRAMSNGSLFVAAGNANFSVSQNMTPNAPTLFGEYTFIRTFLFNANCLSDRAILDTMGDTRFIDLTGVRSFNSVQQTQNEGRNTPFTNTIQAAFVNQDGTNILQDPQYSSTILYDNYELYAVQTIHGPVIAIYDSIINCWTGFDINQTGGRRIKILSKIELAVQALFAIDEDDNIWQLYTGPEKEEASFRSVGVCSNVLYLNQNMRMANPKNEVKIINTRVIINQITKDCSCSYTLFVNNRPSKQGTITKSIKFHPVNNSLENKGLSLQDENTQLENILFPNCNAEQGWKVFGKFSWTNGSVTQFSMELADLSLMLQSLNSR